MPDYRRNRVPGGTFFFTVNLLDRHSELLLTQIDALRDAVRQVRRRAPFRIDRPSRAHALPVDLAASRCRLPRSVARDQDCFCKIVARRQAAITGHGSSRRTRYLAAAVLGAQDP